MFSGYAFRCVSHHHIVTCPFFSELKLFGHYFLLLPLLKYKVKNMKCPILKERTKMEITAEYVYIEKAKQVCLVFLGKTQHQFHYYVEGNTPCEKQTNWHLWLKLAENKLPSCISISNSIHQNRHRFSSDYQVLPTFWHSLALNILHWVWCKKDSHINEIFFNYISELRLNLLHFLVLFLFKLTKSKSKYINESYIWMFVYCSDVFGDEWKHKCRNNVLSAQISRR